MMQIPIHSCPTLAINCSPLAASPTPRHPTDQVTYLHRRHQLCQPSRLTQYKMLVMIVKVASLSLAIGQILIRTGFDREVILA
jgi:hypothetical protein